MSFAQNSTKNNEMNTSSNTSPSMSPVGASTPESSDPELVDNSPMKTSKNLKNFEKSGSQKVAPNQTIQTEEERKRQNKKDSEAAKASIEKKKQKAAQKKAKAFEADRAKAKQTKAETKGETKTKCETSEEKKKRLEQEKYGGQRPERVDKLDMKKFQKINDHYGDIAAAKKSGKVQPPKPTPDGSAAPTISASAAVAPQIVVAQAPAQKFLSDQHEENYKFDTEWATYRRRLDNMRGTVKSYFALMEQCKKFHDFFGIPIDPATIPDPPQLHFIPPPPLPKITKRPMKVSASAPPPPPVPTIA